MPNPIPEGEERAEPALGFSVPMVQERIRDLQAEYEREWALAEALNMMADERYQSADKLETQANELENLLRRHGHDPA